MLSSCFDWRLSDDGDGCVMLCGIYLTLVVYNFVMIEQ